MTRTPARLDAVVTVARFAFAESLRRRVFAVVAVLTVVFLALYGLGSHFAFEETEGFAATAADLADERAITGSTVFGLAMFATLFLGAVLATFLTIGVVRGDAETGLLQPLVVRPLGRGAMLVARYAGAALPRRRRRQGLHRPSARGASRLGPGPDDERLQQSGLGVAANDADRQEHREDRAKEQRREHRQAEDGRADELLVVDQVRRRSALIARLVEGELDAERRRARESRASAPRQPRRRAGARSRRRRSRRSRAAA